MQKDSGHKGLRHSGVSRNPAPRVRAAQNSFAPQTRRNWMPIFIGMTIVVYGVIS